jgi:hypothetical protein
MTKIAHKIGTEVYNRDPHCFYRGRVGVIKDVCHFKDVIVYTVDIPSGTGARISMALLHENVEEKNSY